MTCSSSGACESTNLGVTSQESSSSPRCSRRSFVNSSALLSNRRRGESRVPNAPTAWCALGVVSQHTSIHSGGTGNIRHPPRSGCNAYSPLSPEMNSSCLRRQRIDGMPAPGWADTPCAAAGSRWPSAPSHILASFLIVALINDTALS